jgi:uncharacterized membrane protein
MTPVSKLAAAFSGLDLAAVALMLTAWIGVEVVLRPGGWGARSTGEIMGRYRALWFHEAVARDNRIVDATLLTGLRAAVAFYISAVLIAIGGAVALIGQTDVVALVATDLAGDLSRPRVGWIVKILLVIAALALSLLQFLWSHRVFGYCVVLLGAIPNDPASAQAGRIAEMGARPRLDDRAGDADRRDPAHDMDPDAPGIPVGDPARHLRGLTPVRTAADPWSGGRRTGRAAGAGSACGTARGTTRRPALPL